MQVNSRIWALEKERMAADSAKMAAYVEAIHLRRPVSVQVTRRQPEIPLRMCSSRLISGFAGCLSHSELVGAHKCSASQSCWPAAGESIFAHASSECAQGSDAAAEGVAQRGLPASPQHGQPSVPDLDTVAATIAATTARHSAAVAAATAQAAPGSQASYSQQVKDGRMLGLWASNGNYDAALRVATMHDAGVTNWQRLCFPTNWCVLGYSRWQTSMS